MILVTPTFDQLVRKFGVKITIDQLKKFFYAFKSEAVASWTQGAMTCDLTQGVVSLDTDKLPEHDVITSDTHTCIRTWDIIPPSQRHLPIPFSLFLKQVVYDPSSVLGSHFCFDFRVHNSKTKEIKSFEIPLMRAEDMRYAGAK